MEPDGGPAGRGRRPLVPARRAFGRMSIVTDSRAYGDELAVVIVTYSPGEALPRLLDSLATATHRRVHAVLADNGSTDGVPQRESERADVDFLPLGANLGYGAGANRAVAELDKNYGWIVVSNQDVEYGPGSLDELLAATERWPRGGSFGPLIKEPSGQVYPSARLLPSLGRGAGHALFGKVWPQNPWTRSYRQSEAAAAERRAGWLSGSCLLLRREAFESVDGFDPRYFMYMEDVDLGDRLGATGWLNIYVPTAEITHIGGQATSRAPARMLVEHHRSTYRYLADRHKGPWRAPLRLALRAALAVRAKLEVRAAQK